MSSASGELNVPTGTPQTYRDRVAALHLKLDNGSEPTDDELAALAAVSPRDAERDLPQLFYRRALLQEDRLEREQYAQREQRRRQELGDDEIDLYDDIDSA